MNPTTTAHHANVVLTLENGAYRGEFSGIGEDGAGTVTFIHCIHCIHWGQ